MFQIRPHVSDAVQARQGRQNVEITTNGEGIPLKENWPEQWCTLPPDFERVFKSIYEFEVRADDVFVVTFPKCGTTWTQEAAWLLLHDLDYEGAAAEDLSQRSVPLDLSGIFGSTPNNSVQQVAALKSPRLIKTHLPAHLLPYKIWDKKVKIIYVARNPKDVAVSYCYFLRNRGTWKGDIGEFVDDLINDDIMYTPYWPSVVNFWKMRNESNIFFTSYEEMKHDLAPVLKNMCAFLGKPELSEAQMEKLVKHLSFENMRDNRRTNPTERMKVGLKVPAEFQFMRRGIVGSYKDELSVEMQQKLDKWTEEGLKNYKITPKDIFGVF